MTPKPIITIERKCNFCKKRVWFFPVTPQGKNTAYHSKCFDKYNEKTLSYAIRVALEMKKRRNILIEL